MHTRLLMGLSAAFMGALGLAMSFLPHEILNRVGIPPVAELLVLVQVTGAVYLGFAYLNWMAKGVLIGGIYARPLALGNVLHFTLVAVTLIKAISVLNTILTIVLAFIYAIFAFWFALVFFTHPGRGNNQGRNGQSA